MTSHDITALETQINALDADTVQRATRLVFECSVNLDLALLAVQDAKMAMSEQGRQPKPRSKVASVLAILWAR